MINIIKEPDGTYRVWTDTEVAQCDGRCIGVGSTELLAVEAARQELQSDVDELNARLRQLHGYDKPQPQRKD